LVDLATKDGIFYVHFVYFTAILYILQPFCIFYSHWVYFIAIWYILGFGFFPLLVFCSKKNLATLPGWIRSHEPIAPASAGTQLGLTTPIYILTCFLGYCIGGVPSLARQTGVINVYRQLNPSNTKNGLIT
jgi:hypothetical protein